MTTLQNSILDSKTLSFSTTTNLSFITTTSLNLLRTTNLPIPNLYCLRLALSSLNTPIISPFQTNSRNRTNQTNQTHPLSSLHSNSLLPNQLLYHYQLHRLAPLVASGNLPKSRHRRTKGRRKSFRKRRPRIRRRSPR
jgi:hypothetical protein